MASLYLARIKIPRVYLVSALPRISAQCVEYSPDLFTSVGPEL